MLGGQGSLSSTASAQCEGTASGAWAPLIVWLGQNDFANSVTCKIRRLSHVFPGPFSSNYVSC